MKRLSVLIIACFSLAVGCYDAQSVMQATSLLTLAGATTGPLTPGSSWYTMFGGSGNDAPNSVCQTIDGGYIIAGNASADIPSYEGKTPLNAFTGNHDILVVKLNSLGYINWYTFLGSASGSDEAYLIKQTADKGFIIVGKADMNIATLQGKKPLHPYAAGTDALVVKLDKTGAVSWYTFLGGSAGDDYAMSVRITTDKGYIIAGYTTGNIPSLMGKSPLNGYAGGNDMLVFKLTSSGSLTWYTFLGSTGNDSASSISQTADLGYVITGHSSVGAGATMDGGTRINAHHASATYDMMVVKLLPTGHVSWYTYIGSSADDYCNAGQQTKDGGYIIAGCAGANIASLPTSTGSTPPINAYSAGFDILSVKLDASGYVDWYTFLGSGGNEYGNSIQQTADLGYVIAGNGDSGFTTLQSATPPLIAHSGSNLDGLVVKLEEGGDVSGFTFLGGIGEQSFGQIQQTTDGGYIVVGTNNNDIYKMGGMVPIFPYSGSGDYDFFIVKLNSGLGL
jgi:hypothetical protein